MVPKPAGQPRTRRSAIVLVLALIAALMSTRAYAQIGGSANVGGVICIDWLKIEGDGRA